MRRTGPERARSAAPGARTAERGGAQQRGEEGERVPDLRESLWLRLRGRRAPGEERGGARSLVDFPSVPRGQGNCQNLPGAQPGRLPHEDRSCLGKPDDCEYPEQPGVLRLGAPERRHQTRKARAAHRNRYVQQSAERDATSNSTTGPTKGRASPTTPRRLPRVGSRAEVRAPYGPRGSLSKLRVNERFLRLPCPGPVHIR